MSFLNHVQIRPMCFLVHPAHFTEIKKVCEMLNSESTNIQEEEEEESSVL